MKEKQTDRAAIIVISEQHLLKLLDFEGGKIHDIRRPVDVWRPNEFEIVLEHGDLDELLPGYTMRRIFPTYFRGKGRIDPPKR